MIRVGPGPDTSNTIDGYVPLPLLKVSFFTIFGFGVPASHNSRAKISTCPGRRLSANRHGLRVAHGIRTDQLDPDNSAACCGSATRSNPVKTGFLRK
jgi:hypothetical protein